MRLLDRYIAKQVFVSAAYAVAVIIIILVLGNVFKEILRELAKRPDLSLGFVFKFIGLVIPISLSLAIPFSFLTAILLTFGRLSADSEFVSMRMAGLSMWRICLPVGILAIFFTGICAWVNLSVTPWAKTEMEGMKDSM
ncbi:MAG: LptF/LptG family permease, partial [Verrucomicrobiota bacterium]